MISVLLLRFMSRTVLLVLLSVPFMAGCGGDPNAARETATVSGKVLLFGKPPSKGKITFDPRNPKRTDVEPVTAEIGPDGSYSVEATLGLNRVVIDSEEIRTDPRLDQYRGGGELSCMVSKGTNEQDYKIGSQ